MDKDISTYHQQDYMGKLFNWDQLMLPEVNYGKSAFPRQSGHTECV